MPTWTHHWLAANDATASENRIHSDDVARQYGFRGGLVPGVTVYGAMVPAEFEALGPDWLERGVMAVRLLRPVYDGDPVVVAATGGETERGAVAVELRDSNGEVCASGHAARPDGSPPSAPLERFGIERFPAVERPPRDERPPASPETFARWPVLGELVFTVDGSQPGVVLGETGAVSPGWLLRSANYALSGTVALGPWIHVESDVQHAAIVRAGDRIHVRARVDSLFEKRGHRFVVLDVVWLADGERLAMGARHTAIYEPRRNEP